MKPKRKPYLFNSQYKRVVLGSQNKKGKGAYDGM